MIRKGDKRINHSALTLGHFFRDHFLLHFDCVCVYVDSWELLSHSPCTSIIQELNCEI